MHFDKIDVSEGIDINKTNAPKECIIFEYYYFVDKCLKFQPDVCNGCYDVLMMSININDIAVLNICEVDYRCISNGISKSETVNFLQNADLSLKK